MVVLVALAETDALLLVVAIETNPLVVDLAIADHQADQTDAAAEALVAVIIHANHLLAGSLYTTPLNLKPPVKWGLLHEGQNRSKL